MKPRIRLLPLIILIIVLSNLEAMGQHQLFKANKKADSLWIVALLTKANNPEPVKGDTGQYRYPTWYTGKVTYSSDNLMRITQIAGTSGGREHYVSTIIQYQYNNSIVEQKLSNTNGFDFKDYTLLSIHRLPDKRPTYLAISADAENERDYDEDWLDKFSTPDQTLSDTSFNHIKRITYVASTFRLEQDSLAELDFPVDSVDEDSYTATEDTTQSKSIAFTSYIKHAKGFPKPFFKYLEADNTLSFLNSFCKYDTYTSDCIDPFLDIESKTYKYTDTAFVTVTDSSYYYPSLESLTEKIAEKNYKKGGFNIRVKAIKHYTGDDMGVYPILDMVYDIGSQSITESSDDELSDSLNLQPDYRIQNRNSLILLSTGEYNAHRPGMCGSASYFTSNFWSVTSNSTKLLFSFASNSCHSYTTYSYKQGQEEPSGRLYLKNPSEEDFDSQVEKTYWQNNSTYVFVVSNGELTRNFYLHFNLVNKASPAKLTRGKLYTVKKK
jgi:hypothetical protein